MSKIVDRAKKRAEKRKRIGLLAKESGDLRARAGAVSSKRAAKNLNKKADIIDDIIKKERMR